MPVPVRLTPTVRVAVVWLVVPLGSPEMDAPSGITPPLSWLFGPVPRAGEPGNRLNQSRMICASAQLEKAVSESCGTCLNNGSTAVLPPPGPFQVDGRMLLLTVTIVCAGS